MKSSKIFFDPLTFDSMLKCYDLTLIKTALKDKNLLKKGKREPVTIIVSSKIIENSEHF